MVFMVVLSAVCKKFKLKTLEPFAMPISMFLAMGTAILLAQVLPPSLVTLEWRG
jgi:hypothetical protein